MNDRLYSAFGRLVDNMPEPPTWDEVSSPMIRVSGAPVLPHPRSLGVWAAVVTAMVVFVTVASLTLLRPAVDRPPADAATGDATFLEWSMQNGRRGRFSGPLEVSLNAAVDRPELVGVRLLLYPTLQSNGVYKYQVRIDGTGDICGFSEGLFEIDGNIGQFLNDVFPDPDEMNVGASRPYFPYICEPDPQPDTIDAVLVAPFDLLLEPGVLTMSNSGGTVRFVVSND